MHVAVDAHNLVADRRGIGRYARAVLSRALHAPDTTWTLVVRRLFPDRRALSDAVGGASVRVARRVPDDADVVWFPWNGTFLRAQAPAVATIHDCTPFAYPAPDARTRETEQAPFRRSAATAAAILVQSAYTASEAQRWLGIVPERITVTPLAADPVFTPGTLDLVPPILHGRPFVLCVGAHEARKNTATLVAAFRQAFEPGSMTLVLTRPLAGTADDVVVIDADDRTLAALYRAATLVALPSLSEGFGLPLLEALACGAPVLAARTSALPEVGGDACAWVDRATDVEAWTAALRRLAGDAGERARLAARGPRQAARFSWDRCAEQTVEVLRRVARNAPG